MCSITFVKRKKESIYSCQVIHDDVLLAWDYGHLTLEGAKFVAREYVLPQLLN
jgi:hypothetical protein